MTVQHWIAVSGRPERMYIYDFLVRFSALWAKSGELVCKPKKKIKGSFNSTFLSEIMEHGNIPGLAE